MTDPDLQIPQDALPGMPPRVAVSYMAEDRESSAYETARDTAVQALALTQERLRDLRKQREEINASIKTLVEEEDLLARMTRVRKERPHG